MIYAVEPLIIYDGVSCRPRVPYGRSSWRLRSIRPTFCTGVGYAIRESSWTLSVFPAKPDPLPQGRPRVWGVGGSRLLFLLVRPKSQTSLVINRLRYYFATRTCFWPFDVCIKSENGQRQMRLDGFSNEHDSTASDALIIQWIT